MDKYTYENWVKVKETFKKLLETLITCFIKGHVVGTGKDPLAKFLGDKEEPHDESV